MRDERQTLDRALSLHNKGDIAAAAKLYRRIIEANPNNLQALHFLGVAEAATGNIDRAKTFMRRSLQSSAVNVQFIENYAAVLHRAGEHDELIRLCQHALQFAPTSAMLLHASAAALLAKGHHPEAITQLNQLVAHHPSHFPAHFMVGSALAKTRQHEAALACYDNALRLNPQLAEAYLDKGTIHLAERRSQDALTAYDNALAVRPGFAEAWLGRCYTLIQMGRHEDALLAADKALALRPDFAEASVGRGNALLARDRLLEAAAAYDRALAVRPDLAAAWSGHGNIELRLGRHTVADASFDRALTADPTLADAWIGRGMVALSLGRHDDALAALDRALALNPKLPDAWLARAQVSYLEKRYDDALTAWNKTLALNPDQPDVAAACLRIRQHHCDWAGFEAACEAARSSVRNGRAIAPFMFVGIPSAPREQSQCARTWVESHFRSVDTPIWRGERHDHDRIRVAYLSADFHEHATAQLMAGLFEHHDRSRFEVTAISIGPNDRSDMRRRIEAAFERFVDAKSHGEDQIADMIKALKVDIFVDLKGYTQDARTGIFAKRPAPIQVNYLGFPGTIGARFIDYIVADRTVIPGHELDCYAEKVVWLPNSYQANDRNRAIADTASVRAEHGLPEAAFVFCCFNDNYKITPIVFSCWMRILLAVEDSVLWLYQDNPTAADNLRREAATAGVAPQRLIFARRLSSAEHLARHRCADLFLDTLPYGAHTTASDALWSGLPIVTCLGETFAGRVGASLLNAIQLPELITSTMANYEKLAVELGRNPARLADLKARLARHRLTTPLFDTTQFARHIEAAYIEMMERHQAGLSPDHIRVQPSFTASNQHGPAVATSA
jgi:predicted O-linked N-acetylglucosamine transferase (SPINDLY family)